MLGISVFKSQYKRAGLKFMNFKATTWFERNYKNISTVMVIFASIGAVFYYFSLRDKSDTGKATFFRRIYSEQENCNSFLYRELSYFLRDSSNSLGWWFSSY